MGRGVMPVNLVMPRGATAGLLRIPITHTTKNGKETGWTYCLVRLWLPRSPGGSTNQANGLVVERVTTSGELEVEGGGANQC